METVNKSTMTINANYDCGNIVFDQRRKTLPRQVITDGIHMTTLVLLKHCGYNNLHCIKSPEKSDITVVWFREKIQISTKIVKARKTFTVSF